MLLERGALARWQKVFEVVGDHLDHRLARQHSEQSSRQRCSLRSATCRTRAQRAPEVGSTTDSRSNYCRFSVAPDPDAAGGA